jgi:proteasome lid subunit RPN8/RPN11
MEIDDAGHDLGAIYHSHTRSEPYPSQTDINLAFYPDAIYVIVGLAGEEPDVRSYFIRDGQVTEAELAVL